MSEEKTGGTLLERMFSVGAHFGYSRMRRHPSVSPYIFGTKNRSLIIDLEKTEELLDAAKAFARELGARRAKLLFVGGKEEAQKVVQSAAESLDQPFVAGRWIGGTLTNFGEIKKRIARFTKLRDQKERGDLQKYTKKEQLLLSREIEKLNNRFGGIVALDDQMPAALFVIDTAYEHIAVAEAREKGIPIIGLLNVDCDLSIIDYPIVANDTAVKSIQFFVNEIVEAYQEGTRSPAPEATSVKK